MWQKADWYICLRLSNWGVPPGRLTPSGNKYKVAVFVERAVEGNKEYLVRLLECM